jgi:hypothetical protein
MDVRRVCGRPAGSRLIYLKREFRGLRQSWPGLESPSQPGGYLENALENA